MKVNRTTGNKMLDEMMTAWKETALKKIKEEQTKIMQAIASGKTERDALSKANEEAKAKLKANENQLAASEEQLTQEQEKVVRVKEKLADIKSQTEKADQNLTAVIQKRIKTEKDIALLNEEKKVVALKIQNKARQLERKVAQVRSNMQNALSLLDIVKEDLQQYVKNSNTT